MEAEDVVKGYKKPTTQTYFDVLKQRDAAREQTRKLMRERDQLQMLCQIAAHYIRYLPLRPEDCDQDMIGRLEAASKGDMDVAANPQEGPVGGGSPPPSSSPAPRDAQPPSVQGDLQPEPAPDRGEGGSPSAKDVTLTAVEKKVLKAMGDVGRMVSYDFLSEATDIPRHRIISAMHTLDRLGLVRREGLFWRRA